MINEIVAYFKCLFSLDFSFRSTKIEFKKTLWRDRRIATSKWIDGTDDMDFEFCYYVIKESLQEENIKYIPL